MVFVGCSVWQRQVVEVLELDGCGECWGLDD